MEQVDQTMDQVLYVYPGTNPETAQDCLTASNDCGIPGVVIAIHETADISTWEEGQYNMASITQEDNEDFPPPITFQQGDPAKGRNGYFIEDLLAIAQHRLMVHQEGPYPCEQNDEAIEHIKLALAALSRRVPPVVK